MKTQLFVTTRVHRKKFLVEYFIGSDDIFALVKEGSFFVESGNEKYTVNKNEGMLFRKNVLYHRVVTSPVTMYLFRYRSENPLFSNDHVVFRDQARLSSTFSMLEKLDNDAFFNDFDCREHLFSDLVMQYSIENNTTQNADAKIDPVIEHIRSSLRSPIDLKQLAKKSGLSYVQFLRRFKAHTGLTPSDYISALRLQKAKSLLSNTSLLILEIADACGFENEYYFSNFFKKHTSLSPTAFRLASNS